MRCLLPSVSPGLVARSRGRRCLLLYLRATGIAPQRFTVAGGFSAGRVLRGVDAIGGDGVRVGIAGPGDGVGDLVHGVADPVDAVTDPVRGVANPMDAVADPGRGVADPVYAWTGRVDGLRIRRRSGGPSCVVQDAEPGRRAGWTRAGGIAALEMEPRQPADSRPTSHRHVDLVAHARCFLPPFRSPGGCPGAGARARAALLVRRRAARGVPGAGAARLQRVGRLGAVVAGGDAAGGVVGAAPVPAAAGGAGAGLPPAAAAAAAACAGPAAGPGREGCGAARGGAGGAAATGLVSPRGRPAVAYRSYCDSASDSSVLACSRSIAGSMISASAP